MNQDSWDRWGGGGVWMVKIDGRMKYKVSICKAANFLRLYSKGKGKKNRHLLPLCSLVLQNLFCFRENRASCKVTIISYT